MVKLIITKYKTFFFGFWFFIMKIILWWKKQLKKTLRGIKKEKKIELKKYANQGGIRPRMEVFESNSGPSAKGLVDFPRLCVCPLTEPYHGIHSVALGLNPEATWQAQAWACMVGHGMSVALEHIETKIIKHMGGPGNRTQVPIPARHLINQLSYCVRL